MKKLFTVFVFIFLLVGCGNKQSVLDEKIKCQNLAGERVQEMGSDNIDVSLIEVNYLPSEDTCLMLTESFGKDDGFIIGERIEDIISYKLVASSPTVYNCVNMSDELREICEESVEEFNKIKEKYFPKK